MSTGTQTDKRLMLICPNLSCRRTLDVPESTRGKVLRCAYCNAPFRVPLSPASSGEITAAAREGEKQ
ncbi:MAG: hypothetical protein KKI02_08095 [Planctomycetes bacterium]|nr:hypothetical protein [Planctomycetota bacterium]